jgi:hypothetical protein
MQVGSQRSVMVIQRPPQRLQIIEAILGDGHNGEFGHAGRLAGR